MQGHGSVFTTPVPMAVNYVRTSDFISLLRYFNGKILTIHNYIKTIIMPYSSEMKNCRAFIVMAIMEKAIS